MSNLPAVQQLSKDLASQSKAIESMLPPGMDPKRFLRTTVNAISTHAQADQLMQADRASLFNACQKAAGDGLLLDGKEATLVTFKNQATYMPMVQGLVKLARNSGEITTIIAHVVYKDDKFQYRPGIDEQPMHSPDWFAEDRGEPICSLMPKKRILAIGNGGRNGHQYLPGKGAHFEEWWKKTAIKNVLKYAPKSTYLESALDHDNEGYDPDAVQPDYQTPAQKSAADLNAELGAAPAPQAEVDTSTGELIEHQPAVEDDGDVI